MIIAIDGTSSSGKSSIARRLGEVLSMPVLGTGSIYRALALKMLNFNISQDDDDRIELMLQSTIIQSEFKDGETIISVDGIKQRNINLSSHDVSVFVPSVAQKDFVRDFVRKIQNQEAQAHKDIIIEGRDIGSVVFPNAEIKFFIDADVVTRAKRRKADYDAQGKNYTLPEVIKEIEARDEHDRNREISPLIMTSDAIIIDTSSMSVEESVKHVIKMIEYKK